MEETKMKIGVIIVTYNPSEAIFKTISKLETQVDKIYIIDNNSTQKNKLYNLKLKEKTKIIFNQKNIGLAAAQNIGIKEAILEEMNWVLFLDDDSEIENNFIFEMKEAYLNSNQKEIGILAANILYKDVNKKTYYPLETKFFIKRKEFENELYLDNVIFAISSGSLVKIEAIKKIGLLCEEFFIDSIDLEYCLRMNLNGYKIRVVKKAKLYQRIGFLVEKKIMKFKIYPTNHNPKRHFTQFRNAIWVWKKYIKKYPKFIIYSILIKIYQVFRIVIFEDDKLLRVKYIFKGLHRGIFYKKSFEERIKK